MLDHAWIASHIPHQGTMCLLESVSSWDGDHIQCTANSHRLADNPLRAHNQLGAACGIEYAAQAMAVHGALLAPVDSVAPRVGYLVSIRGTQLHVPRLDTIAADLEVTASCITRNENNILYQFNISADGKLLLDGRATVVVNANSLVSNFGEIA
ncbi:3-hydroxylacyl-ACP dehydratase [Methylovorus sp. MM2]|uniref:3-hydroxylacyl-ACP dehydratase n=1 Tax=Methylovorus sp. MM2 TaxID=1848038 RepID=UPI0007DF14AB|nr:3-hydroxylacyl-ACP dehydratase [Methylovorus sp. MM2]OAM51964.1 3-hydroxylacyl-ACP dehydratase [Methylovorus sp. MM2]